MQLNPHDRHNISRILEGASASIRLAAQHYLGINTEGVSIYDLIAKLAREAYPLDEGDPK